jgi:hypothetical protein
MMRTMRRTIAIVLASSVVLGTSIWAGAAARSRAANRAVAPAAGLLRASRWWKVGPSAQYDFDNGVIGQVTPLQVALPEGANYKVVVSVSLDYRTSPDDRFVVGALVRKDAEFGYVVDAFPRQRAVSASSVRTSTTALFQLSGLEGGHVYWISPTVNVSARDQKASIVSRHVVVVVDATPVT